MKSARAVLRSGSVAILRGRDDINPDARKRRTAVFYVRMSGIGCSCLMVGFRFLAPPVK